MEKAKQLAGEIPEATSPLRPTNVGLTEEQILQSASPQRQEEYQEMKALIRDYRAHQVNPSQVVGDDTIKGVHGGDSQYVRTEVYTVS